MRAWGSWLWAGGGPAEGSEQPFPNVTQAACSGSHARSATGAGAAAAAAAAAAHAGCACAAWKNGKFEDGGKGGREEARCSCAFGALGEGVEAPDSATGGAAKTAMHQCKHSLGLVALAVQSSSFMTRTET